MFTGIIEEVGEVVAIEKEAGNILFTIASDLSASFKIDQSFYSDAEKLQLLSV